MVETAAPNREGLGSGRGWARFRPQCPPICVRACIVCYLPCASRSRRVVYYTPQTPLSVVQMLVRSCYGTVDVSDARGPRVTVFRVRYFVRTRPSHK